MSIKKFLLFFGLTAILAGCGGVDKYDTNYSGYDTTATSNPVDVQESFLQSTSIYGSDDGGPNARIAVLLPMSGAAKTAGNDIKTSIETAFLRKPKTNVRISFYDLSGNSEQKFDTIRDVLNTNPDVVLGPIFAEDTKIINDLKPSYLPVISFTSDTQSLGNGVMTVNLIPTQSIETIMRQIKDKTERGIVIFAPDDKSGQLMTSVADVAADIYDVPVRGIFYYDSGNSDSIKNVSQNAALHSVRTAANNRAREVLSDILINEQLTTYQRKSINSQLEKISRTETLGDLPYDGVLFLGNGDDSKTLASFLRYYGVGNRDVDFYGTTLWQNSDIASDFTMTGAQYATLPDISDNFVSLFNMVGGKDPDYLAAIGYDAANLALGMIYSQKDGPSYFFDPNGYVGTTGIFRIQPDGAPERALRIVELDGTQTPRTIKNAQTNFLTPLYNIHKNNLSTVPAKRISSYGIDPGDYINIPQELRSNPKYKTKIIGSGYVKPKSADKAKQDSTTVYIPDEDRQTISNPEFESVKPESISREYIDSVEIEE